MEELEFNHIAPYLSDGLKYQMQIDNSGTLVTITVDINSLDIHVKRMIGGIKMLYGFAKPIYHPLSDLTKEIEHNGEEISYLNILKEIYPGIGSELEIEIGDCQFETYYEIIQQLFKWHFWIFDQAYFEKGIIININTIKQ